MGKHEILKRWKSDVADQGCVACYKKGYKTKFAPAAIHHVRHINGLLVARNDALIMPLCHAHHQNHGTGISIHDGLEIWEKTYGREQDLMLEMYSRIKSKLPDFVLSILDEHNLEVR